MDSIQTSQSLPSQTNQKDFLQAKGKRNIIGRIIKVLILIIIVFILIQAFFFLKSYFSRYPANRMCWNDSMCKNYCLYDWKPVCSVSETPIITDRVQQIKYILTGKKNVLETFNPNQKYCACNDTSPEQKSREQLYDFYQKNR